MPRKLAPKGQAAPPVEPNVGPFIPRKPAPRRKPVKVASNPDLMYVRNLHHIKSRVTLASGREIQLEPRGQREDLDVVTLEDRDDPRFLANLDLIFELVSPEDAKVIISKQKTNAKNTEHPIWGQLRNERGEAYNQRVMEIEEAFERQGQVVGRIEESGSGRFTDKNFTVARAIGPEMTQVPGSPGHPATDRMLNMAPGDITPEEYREFLLWKEFRAMKERGEETA